MPYYPLVDTLLSFPSLVCEPPDELWANHDVCFISAECSLLQIVSGSRDHDQCRQWQGLHCQPLILHVTRRMLLCVF